jgi:hypothetical protein
MDHERLVVWPVLTLLFTAHTNQPHQAITFAAKAERELSLKTRAANGQEPNLEPTAMVQGFVAAP